MQKFLIVSLILLATVTCNNQNHQPLSVHPDNPHYFIYKGNPTILIGSTEHYGALMNLDFDYSAYFQELSRNNLNTTRTFSGVFTEHVDWYNIVDNTMAVDSGRFVCPWARSNVSGYINGGNKFDLESWDTNYFDRLHDFMKEAGRNGIVVEFVLFSNYYYDHLWKYSPMHPANNINLNDSIKIDEVLTFEYPSLYTIQTRMVKKIVRELNEYDNLYYEICNEPYIHQNVSSQWQYAIIDTLIKTEKKLPKKHLLSINYENRSHHIDSLHPGVSIVNFHYCAPPLAVKMNYHHPVVIGDNETGGKYKDYKYFVREGWDFIIAGGGLFNNLDYSFTVNHPAGQREVAFEEPASGGSKLRKELGHLQDFMSLFNYIQMAPDTISIQNKLTNRTVRVLSNPGKEYAVYVRPAPSTKTNKSIKFETRLSADNPGVYSFFVNCNDGARVYFNGELMLDMWKKWGNAGMFNYTMRENDTVDMIVEYFQHVGDASIEIKWEGENIKKQEIKQKHYFLPNENEHGVKSTLYNDKELGVFLTCDTLKTISYSASEDEFNPDIKENNTLQLCIPQGEYQITKHDITTGKIIFETTERVRELLTLNISEEEIGIRIMKKN